MASTVVGFYFPVGTSSPNAKIFATNGHGAALSSPSLTSDTERPPVCKGTVAEALAGWYSVDLYAGSVYLRTTFIFLADDTGDYFEADPAVLYAVGAAVKLKTDTIGRITWLNTGSDVTSGGVLTIKAGDAHTFTLTSDTEDAVADLTGITCRFGIKNTAGTQLLETTDVTVLVATGFQSVQVAITPAESIAIPAGAALFDVQAEFTATNIRTFITGSVQTNADYSGTGS